MSTFAHKCQCPHCGIGLSITYDGQGITDVAILRAETDPEKARVFAIPLGDLELSVRAYNCLITHSNIRTVGELCQRTLPELLRIKNLGRGTLREITDVLAILGVALGDNRPITAAEGS